jgi:YidC/Oxa1 family membrane protein insertase
MDKNSIIGILLITLLTVVYFQYFVPKPPQDNESAQPNTEEMASNETPQGTDEPEPEGMTGLDTLDAATADSMREAKLRDKYSDFWPLARGETQIVTVTTEELTVNLSTKGGHMRSVFLNHHETYDSLPLPIYTADPRNAFFFEFPYNNRAIRSSELYFRPSEAGLELTGEDSAQLVMVADLGQGRKVEQVYTFHGSGYDVGYDIRMVGLREGLGNVSFYSLKWTSYVPRTELSVDNMRQKSTVVYRLGDDVEKLDTSNELEKEKLTSLVKWVSFKSQFFSQILVAEEPLRSGTVTMNTSENDESVNRIMDAKLVVDIDNPNRIDHEFFFYMGPNKYTELVAYDLDLEEEMDLGWWIIGWINKGTTYIFNFLDRYINNYGLIIIILGLFIRILLLPLSFKSYVSMARMRVINQTPEMKALDEKHKDDPQKLQMAKMGIYKEMGVSMFGGCVPMLFSYPFLIALFFFFPQAVELRHESFLWADDLSTYDSVLQLPFEIPLYGDHVSLFTILMAISTFIYVFYQQQSQPSTGAGAQMKYIAYITPIFLLLFLNNYASGLSLYYFTSNLLQISSTVIIKRFFVNDEKLLAEMHEKKKAARKQKGKKGKGGKGGKGGNGNAAPPKNRLERWLEKQQQKQEELMKARQQQSGPNRRSRRQGGK